MKRVFSAESVVAVTQVQRLLEHARIPAELRRIGLSGALGEVPFLETWPEVWVADEDEARALTLIDREWLSPLPSGPDWACAACGEPVEDTFACCWNCGTVRPEPAT